MLFILSTISIKGMYFVTNNFSSEIKKNVVWSVFPNLNSIHQNILHEYLIKVIDTIAIKFNFMPTKRDTYEDQLRQNGYRDTIGFLLILLPYIHGDKSKLKSLDDLYFSKENNIDINDSEPVYNYSNLQYGRCKRISYKKGIKAEEIPFSTDHLRDNFILLLETIKTIANKLYVNWINIRPVDKASIKKLQSYQETKVRFTEHKITSWNPFNDTDETKYNTGLDGLDIYDLTTNYLYYGIKDIKWTIYEIFIDQVPYKLINMIHSIVNLDSIINNEPWNSLDHRAQQEFVGQLTNLMQILDQNTSYNNLTPKHINYIATTLVIFFNNSNSSRDAINKGYIPLQFSVNEDEEEDNIELEKIEKIKISAKSLLKCPDNFYEYLRNSVNAFKNSWYAQYYLENDKLNQTSEAYYPNQIFTIKNIYNYAKAIANHTDKSADGKKVYIGYPRFWKSLNDDEKSIILARFNYQTSKGKPWFSIKRYIKNIVGIKDKREIEKYNNQIHDTIQSLYPDILFDVMCSMGILTEFVPDKNLTDSNYLPKETNAKNKSVLEKLGNTIIRNPNYRSRWENSIYFINQKRYGDLTICICDGCNLGCSKYIDLISSPKYSIGNWITTYAMDWVSQISFFHKYLNNRIIYVTGGTGVGKSSQVPKLLLYALKMIDYKQNGKIVCTQPRIPPTKKNAITIAYQMGVPIEVPNASLKKDIRSDNYYIQYKYKGAGHDLKQNGLSLQIVTDGLLDTQLKNPLLKKMVGDQYKLENIYDIVIVDEAHEHNKNMDTILTKMKYVTYYNNDIKLVIISATMEEDEPIYRRYYREINDNKMYPLNLFLQKYTLDRVNIDRRIHISEPGSDTQYRIDEFYKPGFDPVGIALDILSSNPTGDILLFQPGVFEIKKTVRELNEKTPDHIIAIPYYSDMTDKKRDIIDKIDRNKHNLTIPKDVPFDEFDETDTNVKLVPKGQYKIIIIVATNIAEASITIDSLRYVVDTGTQKVNIYNYVTRSNNLKLSNISESSRKQRKGRVGRVNSGTVYYTYNEGIMANNKKQFNISISDISDTIYDLLQESPNDIPFFSSYNDPNTKITNLQYQYGIDKIIMKQYFVNGKYFDYVGNLDHYDYHMNQRPKDYYKTGYPKEVLDDQDGSFYIVHPDELCLGRNILGQISKILKSESCCVSLDDKNQFKSMKMKSFWDILVEQLFLVEKDGKYYKTQFGMNLFNFKTNMIFISTNYLLAYIYSRVYECSEDMLKLIAMTTTIRSIKELAPFSIVDEKKRINFDQLKGVYKSCIGDSDSLIKIANEIITFFTKLNSIQVKDIINGSNQVRKRLEEQKNLFINNYESKNFTQIDENLLSTFIQMKNTNRLISSDSISDEELDTFKLSGTHIQDVVKQYTRSEHKIIEWCQRKYLNYEKVIRFYEVYLKLLNSIKLYEDKKFLVDTEIVEDKGYELSWFNTHTPKLVNVNQPKQSIIVSLTHGFYYNIVRRIAIINDNHYYISMLYPNFDNVYKIPKLYKLQYQSKKTIDNETLIPTDCLRQTILFLSKSESQDYPGEEITLLENIDPKLISKLIPYTLLKDNEKRYSIYKHQQYVKKYLDSLTIFKKDAYLHNDIINRYLDTIKSIKTDLSNSSTKKVNEEVTIIDDQKEIKTAIMNQNGGYSINEFTHILIKLLNK